MCGNCNCPLSLSCETASLCVKLQIHKYACACVFTCVCFFCFVFFIIHLFYIVWREGQGRYELLTMVGAGGTRTCVHPHVSCPLYHCATDADMYVRAYVVCVRDDSVIKLEKGWSCSRNYCILIV